MQISSLTHERLERLKKQIADKKSEKDELEALNEKDLWCKDLEAFEEEWEVQMRLDDEIRSNIRKMGRRVSKKIGAGKGGKRKADDDDYAPTKATKNKRPVMVKEVKKAIAAPPKTTAQSRFASTFAKPKETTGNDGADDSDEDFAASFGRSNSTKPEPAKEPTPMAVSDDDDFAALAKPRSRAAKKPAPIDLSDEEEDDEDDFVVPTKPKTKSAPIRKPSPIDLSDEDENDSLPPTEPKAKSKTAPAKKKSPTVELSDDDDDFAAVSKPKAKAKAAAKKPSPVESEVEEVPDIEEAKPTNGRTKRAAAAKAKNWAFDDSEEESASDGENMIGDVGAMVRGIGEPAAKPANGRLSLFAMSRSEHGNTTIPKLKTKQSRNFELDSPDDTNYELLAKSSPQKPTRSSDIDDLLSEGEEPVAAKAASKAKQGKAPLSVVSAAPAKKGRGRPAGATNKAKDEGKPAKSTQLSPAAKAYAAKSKATTAAGKSKKKTFDFSDDDEQDEDGDVLMEDSPPKPRGRPGRAAAAKKKTYAMISEDEEDSDVYAMNESD